MSATVISYSIRYYRVIIVLVMVGIGLSFYALKHSSLDAVPDISDPQIIIYSKWQRSSEMIESEITSPLIRSLLGMKGVRALRGMSYLGHSFVYVIMENEADVKKIRPGILERVNSMRPKLPSGAKIEIGPDASSMGWIYQYALVDREKTYDLRELYVLQENQIKTTLESIQGVAEVATVGGLTKQYQLKIYPPLLAETGISLKKLASTLKSIYQEAGGRVIEITNRDYQIRGAANIETIDQLESLVVGYSRNGKPVQIKDIGYIQVGYDLRRGITDLDGEGEVVGGIIIMQQSENVPDVVKRINKKMEEIKKTLPAGMEIVTTYNRSILIFQTLKTFFKTLAYELIVVIVVMVGFINHYRLALSPILILLLGTLFTIIPLYLFGQTLNLFSIAGLFIAMGEMADAAIVMVENCASELALEKNVSEKRRKEIILKSTTGMARPLFFSLLIIIISFLPVFLLEAQEGKLFYPLAYSKTFAMIFSTLLTFLLLPGFILILFKGRDTSRERKLTEISIQIYKYLLIKVLKYKYIFIIVNLIILLISLPLFLKFEKTFIPDFDEGSILYMPTTLPGLPAKEAGWILQKIDEKLKKFPEVKTVFGKLGRADTATDPAPFTMIETTILLHPKNKWRSGMTRKKLIKEMNQKMKIPGFVNSWTQPIRARVDMQTTGIQTPVGIKVIGDNIKKIEEISKKIESILKDFTGTQSVIAERISEGYFIDVKFDHSRLADHGIPVDEALLYVRFALGGENITWIKQQNGLIPLNLQYSIDYINTMEKINDLMIIAPGNKIVSLSEVATVSVKKLPEMIRNENGFLAGYIFLHIKTRPSDYVERAKEFISKKMKLPDGFRLEWTGQFQYQVRAQKRFNIIIPVTVIIIFLLLIFTFKSIMDSVLIMISIPYALVGGILFQWILGYPMSVAVWVGYIALYAVAVQTGIIMLVFLRQALQKKLISGKTGLNDIEAAAIEGAILRLRPKLMTVSTTILSLLPVMLSSGPGLDIMKPIAAPTIGGMITSTVYVLFLIPCLFVIKSRVVTNLVFSRS